jgi:hypothetical protein
MLRASGAGSSRSSRGRRCRSGLASVERRALPDRTGEFASAGFPTHVVPAATAPTLNEVPRELHPFRRTAQSARTTSTSSGFFSWSPAPSTSSTPFRIVTDMPVALGATSRAPSRDGMRHTGHTEAVYGTARPLAASDGRALDCDDPGGSRGGLWLRSPPRPSGVDSAGRHFGRPTPRGRGLSRRVSQYVGDGLSDDRRRDSCACRLATTISERAPRTTGDGRSILVLA